MVCQYQPIITYQLRNISKYNNLKIKREEMWHFKTTTVPVIVGDLGMIKKETDIEIRKIPGSPNQHNIQETAP